MAPNTPEETAPDKYVDYILMPRDEVSQVLEDIYYLINRRIKEDPNAFQSILEMARKAKEAAPQYAGPFKKEAINYAATHALYASVL